MFEMLDFDATAVDEVVATIRAAGGTAMAARTMRKIINAPMGPDFLPRHGGAQPQKTDLRAHRAEGRTDQFAYFTPQP